MKLLISAVVLMSFPLLAFDHSYSDWNSFLAKHVEMYPKKSELKYKEAVKERAVLDSIVEKYSKVKKEDFKSWSQKQQMAFLINVYNAHTVKVIVDHYPVGSIKDSKIAFLSPFKKDFYPLFGEKRSLGYIEHDLLRPDYKDARIHFAIVCAAVGCPSLQNKAFTVENMDELFEKGAKMFLSDSSRNRLDGDRLRISKIFDWFEGDFDHSYGSVQEFLEPYLNNGKFSKEQFKKLKISYTKYDWDLNEKK
ncbi:MAG: DUF547 domain-containing protein [Bdellovibrionales bacterium]